MRPVPPVQLKIKAPLGPDLLGLYANSVCPWNLYLIYLIKSSQLLLIFTILLNSHNIKHNTWTNLKFLTIYLENLRK